MNALDERRALAPPGRLRLARLRGLGVRGLLAAALLLLGVCLLGPSASWSRPQHEFVVVIDVTQSMMAADMRREGQQGGQPLSRLAEAKWALERALRRLPCGSKLGWGLFTEYRSFLLLEPVEVCEHRRELLSVLSQIDGRMAWTGNSEIAKGLYSGLKIAKALPSKPALVFVTDGQEAPPVSASYRPSDEGAVRVAPGLIVGVGGMLLVPIPKLDVEGRAYGYWQADEVMQMDPRSLGRGGSVAGERMADDGGAPSVMLGATPGTEHRSALRESYLQLLAAETGLQYQRLATPEALYAAMTDARLAHPVEARVDLRWVFALAALLCIAAVYLMPKPVRSGAR